MTGLRGDPSSRWTVGTAPGTREADRRESGGRRGDSPPVKAAVFWTRSGCGHGLPGVGGRGPAGGPVLLLGREDHGRPGAVATASLPVWRGPQLGGSSHQSRMRAIPPPVPLGDAGDLTDLWPPEDGQARAPALRSLGGLQGHAPFLSFVPFVGSLREGASCLETAGQASD